MPDIKSLARELAAQAKQKLEAQELHIKRQLHRRRILDAELRPAWRELLRILTEAIAEYDSDLKGTLLEQDRKLSERGDSAEIEWRYPNVERLTLDLQFERGVIAATKKGSSVATTELRATINDEDRILFVRQNGSPVGDVSGAAEEILRFMLAGSGV